MGMTYMHWKFTSYKKGMTLSFLITMISFNSIADPTFNLKNELVGTAFFPVNRERNPLRGSYQARSVYGNTINYYIDRNSESFFVEYHRQSFLFQSIELLQRAFARWGGIHMAFNRVYSRDDADFLFYQTDSYDLANAIAYPTGYYHQNSFSEQGRLQIHINQIENTLNNLNSVDIEHIHFNSERELIESVLTFIFTHELGHVIGFAHPTRYSDYCGNLLSNQAPIMSNLQDYFRIQFHINGDIPVHQLQINPSEREIRDFNSVNSGILSSKRKREVSYPIEEFCDHSKRDFILKVTPILN